MTDDLVLLEPHVHEWVQHLNRIGPRGVPYGGQIPEGQTGPALSCECGEQAGDWSEQFVDFDLTIDTQRLNLAEVFPDGIPPRVTLEVIKERLEQCGQRELIGDGGLWGLLDGADLRIVLHGKSVSVRL